MVESLFSSIAFALNFNCLNLPNFHKSDMFAELLVTIKIEFLSFVGNIIIPGKYS